MRARRFWIHVDSFSAPRGRVWAVQTAGLYLTATRVDCLVGTETVFRGNAGRQPKAFLQGKGVVRQRGSEIRITET